MSEEQAEYITKRAKAENAALKKYAAIQKAAEEKIGVQKIYIDMTGDIEAAFILDEVIFFTLPRGNGKSALRVWKDGYLWLAVQRADWWDRKRLTVRQADTAIKKLEEKNLIVKSVHKFNGQTSHHLRLNVSEFFRQYGEALEKSNPAEDESDTMTKDISDLYAMMGELQNCDSQIGELQNGETELQNGETELQNGDSINTPHHPSPSLTQRPLSIENAIAVNQPIEGDEQIKMERLALETFEHDLQLPANWQWYPAKTSDEKAMAFLREFIVRAWRDDPRAFEKYQTWRNTPYVKGAMSNLAIKRNPENFPVSWSDYLAHSAMYGEQHKTDESRPDFSALEAAIEREKTAVPRPAHISPPNIKGIKR